MNKALQPATVIIVEDELSTAEMLKEMVEEDFPTQIKVVGLAKNYLEAYQLIKEEGPDLALLDIKMPGQETIFQLLESLQVENIALPQSIIITAYPYQEYYNNTINKFNGIIRRHLIKPINHAELYEAIAYLLKLLSPQKNEAQIGLEKDTTLKIDLPNQKRYLKIPFSEFVYASTKGNSQGGIVIHTDTFTYNLDDLSLKKFYEDNNDLFIFKITKFEVINLYKVREFTPAYLRIIYKGELHKLNISPIPAWRNQLEEKLNEIDFFD